MALRVALAALLALLLAAALAFSARGGPRAWKAYLAPAGACSGATDPTAAARQQRRALRCLLNWARARAWRGQLTPSRRLRRAATLKGHRVASCDELDHAPCGSTFTAAVRAAGYRFTRYGENLYAGPWARVSPREVAAAWLRSPAHRANVLGRYRNLGAAVLHVPALRGAGDAVVWVVAFGSPR